VDTERRCLVSRAFGLAQAAGAGLTALKVGWHFGGIRYVCGVRGFCVAAAVTLATVWGIGPARAQAPLHKLLVLSGESAPDAGTFYEFGDATSASVDSAAFRGAATAGEEFRTGIWHLSPGRARLVADTRTEAPGTDGLFCEFATPAVNPSGAVVFNGFVGETSLQGTWLGGKNDGIQPLAIQGQPLVQWLNLGGMPVPLIRFLRMGPPTVNASGDAAFKAELSSTLNLEGPGTRVGSAVMISDKAFGTTAMVKEGDVLPAAGGGYRILNLFNSDDYPDTKVDMNNSGRLLFAAVLGDADSDYYSWDALLFGRPDNLMVVAETGVPAPGLPGTFVSRIREGAAVNNAGEVAFVADYYNYSDLDKGHGASIFAGLPGELQPAVSEGDIIPRSDGLRFGRIRGLDLNDFGDVVFEADIVYPEAGVRRALWLKTAREPVRLLVAEGNHLPTGLGVSEVASWLNFTGPGSLNEFGQVAFVAGFEESERQGVYLANTYFQGPGLRLLQPNRRGQVTDQRSILLKGVATSPIEIDRVDVTVKPVSSARAVKRKKKVVGSKRSEDGRTVWSAVVPLEMGRNRITVRALDVLGNDSGTMEFVVIRYDSREARPTVRPGRPKLRP
jgi:hypothetical protein